jgi:hypothetical protein
LFDEVEEPAEEVEEDELFVSVGSSFTEEVALLLLERLLDKEELELELVEEEALSLFERLLTALFKIKTPPNIKITATIATITLAGLDFFITLLSYSVKKNLANSQVKIMLTQMQVELPGLLFSNPLKLLA